MPLSGGNQPTQSDLVYEPISFSAAQWKSRFTRRGWVDAKAIAAHPLNWRVHPPYQKELLGGVLDEVGWVQQIVVSEDTQTILDGHLRVALVLERSARTGKPGQVPVQYVKVSVDEEALVLAALDPISAMGETHAETYLALTEGMAARNAQVGSFVNEMRERAADLAAMYRMNAQAATEEAAAEGDEEGDGGSGPQEDDPADEPMTMLRIRAPLAVQGEWTRQLSLGGTDADILTRLMAALPSTTAT